MNEPFGTDISPAKAGVSFGVEVVDCTRNLLEDKFALTQGLMNIVRNAVEATPPGGSITLKGLSEHGGVTLSVTDTGSGISDEFKLQIFQSPS